MSDLNINDLKKTWQEQKIQPKYLPSEIIQMLQKKSRNYVKYIFWISLAELIIFSCMSVFYVFKSENNNSFLKILKKLGVHQSPEIQQNFEHLYLGLKVVSLIVTALFVVLFYINYKKIKIQDNLKVLISQIVKFRKTVNTFIFINIFLLILFTSILTLFIFQILSEQNIFLTQPNLINFIAVLSLTILFSVVFIWLYYKVVYGIILKKLGKNLAELQKIEEE